MSFKNHRDSIIMNKTKSSSPLEQYIEEVEEEEFLA